MSYLLIVAWGIMYYCFARYAPKQVVQSAWSWTGIFSGWALIAIVVIGPKYAQREAANELRTIGRARAIPSADPHVSGQPEAAPPAADGKQPPNLDDAPLETELPRNLVVPLVTLGAIFGLIFSIAVLQVVWQLVVYRRELKRQKQPAA